MGCVVCASVMCIVGSLTTINDKANNRINDMAKGKDKLTPKAKRIAGIISKGKNVTRRDIADALGKKRLSQHETILLDRLGAHNVIVESRVPKGHLLTYVYNLTEEARERMKQ